MLRENTQNSKDKHNLAITQIIFQILFKMNNMKIK
jgi:hypothetical protein